MAANTWLTRRGISLSVGRLVLLLLVLAGCTPPSSTPIAVITADTLSGEVPFAVHFDGSASYDPGGADLVDYAWSFGDGCTAAGATVEHSFTVPGTYDAELAVTNALARTSQTRIQVTGLVSAEGRTSYDGVARMQSGEYLQPVRVTDEIGTPLAGIQCHIVTDGGSAVAFTCDPAWKYIPAISSVETSSPLGRNRPSTEVVASRQTELVDADIVLHNIDKAFAANGFVYPECLSRAATLYFLAAECSVWKQFITLDELAAQGCAVLLELFPVNNVLEIVIVEALSLASGCSSEAPYRAAIYGVEVPEDEGADAASQAFGLMVEQVVGRYRADGYSGSQRLRVYKQVGAIDQVVVVLPLDQPLGGAGQSGPRSTIAAPLDVVLPAIESGQQQSVDFGYQVVATGGAAYFTARILPDGNTYSCPLSATGTYSGSLTYVAPPAGQTKEYEIQGQLGSTPSIEKNADSETVKFRVTVEPATELLDAPQLASPEHTASQLPSTLTLQWDVVTGANGYWVLVAENSADLPTDVTASVCPNCTCAIYARSNQLPLTLSPGKTYYWCVQAFNDATSPITQGRYSEVRSFSTSSGTCEYALTLYQQSFMQTGGSGAFAVDTGDGCAWTATSDSVWIVLTTSTGTGPGPVYYTVPVYSESAPRTGHITVQGETFTVTQNGATPCVFSLSPSSASYTDATSHTGSFGVTTGSGCAWAPVVDAADRPWLSASASAPSGSGTVTYSVGANDTTAPRTGEIRVQDKTFTITQAGKSPPVIELDHVVVSGPTVVNENSVGTFTCTAYLNDGSLFDVTSAASWTEDSPSTSVSAGKLTVGSLTGDSSCAVRASYTYNGINKWAFMAVVLKDTTTVLDRIEVTGPTVVNENSSGDFVCRAYFSDGSSAIVTGAAGWTCSPSSSWGTHPSTVTIAGGRLSVGALDGDDDWAVTASYTYGTSTKYRGVAVHLHDTTPPPPPPDPCAFEVGPTTAPRVAAQGGSGVICVRTSADCQWQAVASDSWIHVTTGKDYTGNGDVGYTVDVNSGPERSGTIVAADRTCTIPQSGKSPPVARITMSAQGQTAYEGGTLNLTMAIGATVRVALSAARSTVDTGTPSAFWFIDGFLGPSNSETYWDFATAGTHTVRLDVLNSDGASATAQAQVVIAATP